MFTEKSVSAYVSRFERTNILLPNDFEAAKFLVGSEKKKSTNFMFLMFSFSILSV
jgi:hypothetical protein